MNLNKLAALLQASFEPGAGNHLGTLSGTDWQLTAFRRYPMKADRIGFQIPGQRSRRGHWLVCETDPGKPTFAVDRDLKQVAKRLTTVLLPPARALNHRLHIRDRLEDDFDQEVADLAERLQQLADPAGLTLEQPNKGGILHDMILTRTRPHQQLRTLTVSPDFGTLRRYAVHLATPRLSEVAAQVERLEDIQSIIYSDYGNQFDIKVRISAHWPEKIVALAQAWAGMTVNKEQAA
jgi:hypothetical protein